MAELDGVHHHYNKLGLTLTGFRVQVIIHHNPPKQLLVSRPGSGFVFTPRLLFNDFGYSNYWLHVPISSVKLRDPYVQNGFVRGHRDYAIAMSQ